LTALAAPGDEHDELLRQLFLYRFDRGQGLSGHNFGNLFLTVLTDILGSEVEAIKAASRILRVAGTVLPVTTNHTHLKATYADGTVVVGEHAIESQAHPGRITELSLTHSTTIYAEAARALSQADFVILGPGDLYTSVLANCVVPGFSEALQKSGATVIYITNLMSRPGQTTGFGSAEHLAEIVKYTGVVPQVMLVNEDEYPADLLKKYAAEDTYPVANTGAGTVPTKVIAKPLLAREIIKTVAGDVLERSLIRHDSVVLADTLLELFATHYPSALDRP
jgi:uncharacterized cofD-like protein